MPKFLITQFFVAVFLKKWKKKKPTVAFVIDRNMDFIQEKVTPNF